MRYRPTALVFFPLLATVASAQEAAEPAAPTEATLVALPVAPQPAAPPYNPDAHLPSSSQGTTDTSRSNDSFDLNRGAPAPTLRGNPNGSFIITGQGTPELHTVQRGETLWDIAAEVQKNPYAWPALWGMNPQIQNPHWIYPGDRVRLRAARATSGGADSLVTSLGLVRKVPTVPSDTVFLREVGWVDDPKNDTWGQIVASPEEHMLIGPEQPIYVKLGDEHVVAPGDRLTIFKALPGRHTAGQVVSVRGLLKVDRYNEKTRMASATVLEAIDVIERGMSVGPVVQRFDVVSSELSDQDLEARIITSIYPQQLYGQHQVVFINKGSADGVRAGNRFFAVSRGDRWRDALHSGGDLARSRALLESDEPAQVEDDHLPDYETEELPDEFDAELRVLRVREHASAALIVASKRELNRETVLITRSGY